MSDADVYALPISDAKTDRSFRPLISDGKVNAVNFAVPVARATYSVANGQYQIGFEAGQQIAHESFEIERAHYKNLIANAQAIQSEPSEELASLIITAVGNLVTKIVGNAPTDAEWLNSHALSAAALISDCDAARTLWLHPDDIELIDQASLGLTIMANPNAERGSISIECSQGWIEHGRALYLDQMTELLRSKDNSE